jgi:transposase-like protein
MSKHRKTWSHQDKLAVVEYQKMHGTAKTSRHFGVSNVSIGKWKRLFEEHGKEGLSGKNLIYPKVDPELVRLEQENRALKAIVAEKELQIRIQAEMIKKNH